MDKETYRGFEGGTMPKGILEFSLPEENAEFDCARYGGTYKGVLEEFSNYLRNIRKHGMDGKMLSPTHSQLVDNIAQEFHDQLESRNITLFE